jgi:hypothetical protein
MYLHVLTARNYFLEETTDMPQVADKLYHIMLCRVHLVMNRIQTYKCHDIAEILLKLVLNTNQSINEAHNFSGYSH